MRQALEAAIRARIREAAPQLVGDLWGRERLTLTVTRLQASLSSDVLPGEVEVLLLAETPDAIDLEAILRAFASPIQQPPTPDAYGLRARLARLHERIEEMTATCRLVFEIEVMR